LSRAILQTEASKALIQRVSKLVNEKTGVQLGTNQQAMVFYRIRKRMTDLELETPESYLEFLEQHLEQELGVLVSLLTTHHTYFFREFTQFEYLEKEVLPGLIAQLRAEGRKQFKLWSAACSRGQEVYSLAMFLHTYLQEFAPDLSFEILGTDIDPESIKIAENGVYRWDEVKEIPARYLQNYWSRGTGEISSFAKVKQKLKAFCKFETQNLFERSPRMDDVLFDIIFCRNVFIYFNQKQIHHLTVEIMKHLNPQGAFFIAVSESLSGLKVPVKLVGPSVYKHMTAVVEKVVRQPIKAVAPVVAKRSGPVRVLCVDDSPTVLTLLKKILTADCGFHIVETAANGDEAIEILKREKFDVITLDIHMPVKNGVEFMEAMRGRPCPPVVVVSSVSREESSTGIRMLELGAKDYVEKPSMADINAKAEEIRMKVKFAAHSPDFKSDVRLEKSFSKPYSIQKPKDCLRVVFASFASRDSLVSLVDKFNQPHDSYQNPPLLVLLHGPQNLYDGFLSNLNQQLKKPLTAKLAGESMQPMGTYVAHIDAKWDASELARFQKLSLMVLGDLPEALVTKIKTLPEAHVLVEDLGSYRSPSYVLLRLAATRAVPVTSFDYHSTYFLAGGGK